MVINIQGTEIDLTPALKQYAQEKIGGLTKFFENIQQADIDIGKTSNHHKNGPQVFYAEVNMHIPGRMVRVRKEEGDLYKAIDKVKDHLKQELDAENAKMKDRDRELIRETKAYDPEEI